MINPRLCLVASLLIAPLACVEGGPADMSEGSDSDGASEKDSTTLWIDTDASALCISGVEQVEIVTRRRDCWDPSVPCTLAQNPPWVVGTVMACDAIEPGERRWEVTVTQTGRWETRLQAVIGADAVGETCLGAGGEAWAKVARADLESDAQIMLEVDAAGDCSD